MDEYEPSLIFHLLMSRESGYIESLYTNAYTSLECIVANLALKEGMDKIIDDKQFSRLEKDIRSMIKIQYEGDENKDIRASLYQKISELRRRSFAETLLLLIDKYELDVSNLWPQNTDAKDAIRKLVQRRNKYIHEGKVTDHQFLVYDRNRIQNLVELWLLRLLGWSPEDLENIHIEKSVPITSPDAPI